MPTGRADKINEAGVKFYHKCLDSLLQNQIEPRVKTYFLRKKRKNVFFQFFNIFKRFHFSVLNFFR